MATAPASPKFFASCVPGLGTPINGDFAVLANKIQNSLGVPLICFIQKPDETSTGEISGHTYQCFLKIIEDIPKNQKVAILLDSPGGSAHVAYRVARMLHRHCGSYDVVVPRYAKSAATLLSLGAEKIFLGDHAEIGPLDVQITDPNREQVMSALEVVQSLERLNSEATQAVDIQMSILLQRSQKKVSALLPVATKFVAEMMRPLLEKIDVVEFTLMARLLKIGQDYAFRLLQNTHDEEEAEVIAAHLTKSYSDHGFVIDYEESTRIGLQIARPPDDIRPLLTPNCISKRLGTIIGLIKEDPSHARQISQASRKEATEQPGQNRRASRARNRNGQSPKEVVVAQADGKEK